MPNNAKLDENSRPTAIAVSSLDGVTIVPLLVNPTNHQLVTDNNTTGTDLGNNSANAMIDQNGISVWTALSSAGDGSIVEIYADISNSKLLLNSL